MGKITTHHSHIPITIYFPDFVHNIFFIYKIVVNVNKENLVLLDQQSKSERHSLYNDIALGKAVNAHTAS